MQSMAVRNIKVNNNAINFVCDNKDLNEMNLNDIKKIIAETNDSGPADEDFFIVLVANDVEIRIPGSENNFTEILARLQLLDGFNNELFIEACSCVENKQFVCWEK